MTTRFRLGAAALSLLAIPTLASAYSSGPPDGVSGNPPFNANCTECHFSFDVNSGDGSLELLGLPAEYVPGQVYPLTVQLSDPGQVRWGFELTVLDDADFALQGGQLQVTDPTNTQISLDSETEADYLKHTFDGIFDGVSDGPVSWDFEWVAPGPEKNSVTFYVAGNAADGDFSLTNDYIYTTTITLRPSDPTPIDDTSWGRIKRLFDN
ncbi:MAG: choice-of-anchor V domain-containing protein [Candidatus Eisenbacteria bacterium]